MASSCASGCDGVASEPALVRLQRPVSPVPRLRQHGLKAGVSHSLVKPMGQWTILETNRGDLLPPAWP